MYRQTRIREQKARGKSSSGSPEPGVWRAEDDGLQVPVLPRVARRTRLAEPDFQEGAGPQAASISVAEYDALWAKTVSESRFQKQVIDHALMNGWELVYHTWISRRSNPGFPDLVMLKPPRVIFAELKRESGMATYRRQKTKTVIAQKAWLDTLARCPGVEQYLWHPSIWREVYAILDGTGPLQML